MVEAILSGDRRALARLITQIENDRPEARQALARLYTRAGRAHIVGVTGAPGTGKSSLVSEIAKVVRREGRSVGIIAVDPTSPFTGGAILGDRIRMRDLAGDPGVFIRSMATRGSLSGLARATAEVATVLDAAGFDMVLVETVGAGQSEVEIAQMAQTVAVVEAPGMGDEVQAIKAGILEIADVLVVNKADQPGAEAAVRTLRSMLQLAGPTAAELRHHGMGPAFRADERAARGGPAWQTPICETVATQGKGVEALATALDAHRAHLLASGELTLRQRERVRSELETLLRETLLARLKASLSDGQFAEAVERVLTRSVDPRTAMEALLENWP